MIGSVLVAVVIGIILACAAYSAVQSIRIESRFPPIGKFADVAGLRLHYLDLPTDDPNDPVIVFIHGASGNLRDPMVAFRPGLAGRFRLIFVDRPGHGYSTRGSTDMSAPATQAAVIHTLLLTLGIERAVIVGHSWGAAVASSFAVKFPGATAGLVLLAPATHPWPGGVDWYYTAATTPIIGQIFVRTIMLPSAEALLGPSLKAVFAPTPMPSAYLDQAGVQLVFRPSAFIANAEDVSNLKANVTAFSPRYREITAPTLIFAGANDTVVRNDLHADALAREIPGARLMTLPNAGHMPQFSAPEQVITAIDELATRSRMRDFAVR